MFRCHCVYDHDNQAHTFFIQNKQQIREPLTNYNETKIRLDGQCGFGHFCFLAKGSFQGFQNLDKIIFLVNLRYNF